MKKHTILLLCLWGLTTTAHGQFYNPYFVPQFYQPPIQPFFNLPPPATVTYNVAPQQPQFQGFGYRTDLKNGASSTVFYVTGAEAENIRNFRDFPNFQRVFSPKSLASDISDSKAVPNPIQKINNILQLDDFEKLFNHHQGVINFYSYPASTAPLVPSNSSQNENEGAESVINSHFVVNKIEDVIKESEPVESSATLASSTEEAVTSTTTSESTVSSTTETSQIMPETTSAGSTTTTTEDPESIVIEARRAESENTTSLDSTKAETETDVTTEKLRIEMYRK